MPTRWGVRLIRGRYEFRMGYIPAFAIVGALFALNPSGNIRSVAPRAGWARNRKPEIGLVNNRRQVSDR